MKSAYELATSPNQAEIVENWTQEQWDEHLSQLATELEEKLKRYKAKLPWNQVQSIPEPVIPKPIQNRIDEEPDFSEYRHLDLRY